MLYTSRALQVVPGEVDIHGRNILGVQLGAQNGVECTRKLFLPTPPSVLRVIEPGLHKDLSLQRALRSRSWKIASDEGRPPLWLFLSSRFEESEKGHGHIYALVEQATQPAIRLSLKHPENHSMKWSECAMTAEPGHAFLVTWQCAGELVRARLYVVDQCRKVRMAPLEQAAAHLRSCHFEPTFTLRSSQKLSGCVEMPEWKEMGLRN